MVEKHSPPAFNQSRFTCPRCGAFAAQEWRPLHYWDSNGRGFMSAHDRGVPEWHFATTSTDEEYEGYPWVASTCSGCEDQSLWINGQLAFPTERMDLGEVPEPNADMPTNIIELYREAAAVLPHSRRAAAALCRAALEELAKYLTPELDPKIKLDGRLVNLSGRMAQETTLALQVIRHVGNTALHGQRDGDESVVIYLDGSDNEIAGMFFVAINDLATELISRPARIKAAYAKLPQTVRDDFERKSGIKLEG